MTPSDRARLVELCERATPGPWIVVHVNSAEARVVQDPPPHGVNPFVARISTRRNNDPNSEFIAAARSALPELLAENERLRKLVVEACGLIDELTEETPDRAHAQRARAISKELSNV